MKYILIRTLYYTFIPNSHGCIRDYIDVFTSVDSSEEPLGHVCGFYSSYIFSTYSSAFFIYYHTDGQNTGGDAQYVSGFSAFFEASGKFRMPLVKRRNMCT